MGSLKQVTIRFTDEQTPDGVVARIQIGGMTAEDGAEKPTPAVMAAMRTLELMVTAGIVTLAEPEEPAPAPQPSLIVLHGGKA